MAARRPPVDSASVFDEEREWLRAWRVWGGALIVLGIAAGIVGACGGFAVSARRELPLVAAGSRLVTDDWVLRPLKARLANATPLGTVAPDGSAFLILEADVENRTRKSRIDVDTAIRWMDPSGPAAAPSAVNAAATPGTPPDAVIVLRDPSFGAQLHPGIAERIALTWKVPAATPSARTQEWLLMGRKWDSKDRLNGGGNWLNRRALARTRLHVDDARRVPREATP